MIIDLSLLPMTIELILDIYIYINIMKKSRLRFITMLPSLNDIWLHKANLGTDRKYIISYIIHHVTHNG